LLGENAFSVEESDIKSYINSLLDLDSTGKKYSKTLGEAGDRLKFVTEQLTLQENAKKLGEQEAEEAQKYTDIMQALGKEMSLITTKVALLNENPLDLEQKSLDSAINGILDLDGATTKYASTLSDLGNKFSSVNSKINAQDFISKLNESAAEGVAKLREYGLSTDDIKKRLTAMKAAFSGFTSIFAPAQLKGFFDAISTPVALEGMVAAFDKMKESMKSLGNEAGTVFEKIGKSIGIPEGEMGRFVDSVNFGISTISGIFQQGFENRKANLDNYYTKEQARINNSKLTEEQKQAALLKLEENVSKKKRKIAHDEAKASKRRNIFEATLAGANAVLSALKLGPIAGPIAAAVIGGLAAVQIGAIASAPLPALAKGGLAYGPTTALVGDNRNAGVDPEVIAPLSKLERIMGGSRYVPEVTIRNGDIKIVSDYNVMLDKRLRGA
jgi:flagellar biosynthesis chaperone FliJ